MDNKIDEYTIDLTIPHISREEIQTILGGMKPRSLENYRKALVHKSLHKHIKYNIDQGKQLCSYLVLMSGNKMVPASNERLEFLGDSILNSIVSGYLFSKFPDKDEGFLTRLKTKIVRDTHCVKFSNIIKLGPYILTGTIVKKDINGNYNDKLLEDAFEAFLGAIYLDLGFKFSNDFIVKLIEKHVDLNALLYDDNYKDILMRVSQVKGIILPEYRIIYQNGPPHQRVFTIQVYLTIDGIETPCGVGTGSSKKEAEQSSASATLDMMDEKDIAKLANRDIDSD